jgi:DNA-binding NarL/FixJ family response regulator
MGVLFMLRLLIVDDHALLREGLVCLLGAQPDFRVVGQAGSVREAIAAAHELRPDVVLMDFGLPDGTGLEATQAILAEQPQIQIVFLTIYEEDERLFAAIRSGAKGYLLKDVPTARLLAYLRGLERGEAAISGVMTSHILGEFSRLQALPQGDQADVGELTPREAEVLRELTGGATNKEIASRLVISENTVKRHVRSILIKLNLCNRREAARFAQQHGLLGPSSAKD